MAMIFTVYLIEGSLFISETAFSQEKKYQINVFFTSNKYINN